MFVDIQIFTDGHKLNALVSSRQDDCTVLVLSGGQNGQSVNVRYFIHGANHGAHADALSAAINALATMNPAAAPVISIAAE